MTLSVGLLLYSSEAATMNDVRHSTRVEKVSLDTINQRAWKLATTVRTYELLEGWTDPGEQAAIDYIADEMRARPILDIGVGAGRTTSFLRRISEDYIGIDYTAEMIDACKRKYPHAAFLHMDARDLSQFADNQFALAMFSFNGIDAVSFTDRQRVLREVHRVLQPHGVFIVSAHNRNGPGYGERPTLRPPFTRNPFKLGWRMLNHARSFPLALRNYLHHSILNETYDEWAVMNCAAHDFNLVVVYTTLAEQTRQLTAAGFRPELVLDNVKGQPVTAETRTSPIWWFHYIARKVASARSDPMTRPQHN
jgi:ubiquinone/menaquinone biosynthesis C-methylase UbiE